MAELITRGERAEFTSDLIKKRGFVRAKFWSWAEPRNGLVTYASKEYLRVLFQTGVNVSTSYYTIKIAEVEAGLWQITYTPDLETFYYIGKDNPAEESTDSDTTDEETPDDETVDG